MEPFKNNRGSFHTEIEFDEGEDGDPLCCCEYFDRNHERNHILLCCCNCKDLDEVIERFICCRSIERRHSISMLLTFQDRLRIPWSGGAKQLSLDFLLPLIIIPTILLCSSTHFIVAIVTGIITLILLSLFYYQFRSSAYRTRFFFIWLICSCIYMKIIFQLALPLYEILPHENLLFIFLIAVTIYCFFKTKKNAHKNWITQGLSSEDDLEDITEEQTSVLIDQDEEEENSLDNTPEICRNCRKYVPPRSFHCILCQACILRGDHHSLWLDCCIGQANHRIYLVGLFFSLLSLFWGVYLALTSVCYGYRAKSFLGFNLIMLEDCTCVYEHFETSFPFVTAVYGACMFVFVLLAFCMQIYCISNGITVAEWHKGQKNNQKTIIKNLKSFLFWLH